MFVFLSQTNFVNHGFINFSVNGIILPSLPSDIQLCVYNTLLYSFGVHSRTCLLSIMHNKHGCSGVFVRLPTYIPFGMFPGEMSLDRMVVLSLSFKGTLVLISRVPWLMDTLTSVYTGSLWLKDLLTNVYMGCLWLKDMLTSLYTGFLWLKDMLTNVYMGSLWLASSVTSLMTSWLGWDEWNEMRTGALRMPSTNSL